MIPILITAIFVLEHDHHMLITEDRLFRRGPRDSLRDLRLVASIDLHMQTSDLPMTPTRGPHFQGRTDRLMVTPDVLRMKVKQDGHLLAILHPDDLLLRVSAHRTRGNAKLGGLLTRGTDTLTRKPDLRPSETPDPLMIGNPGTPTQENLHGAKVDGLTRIADQVHRMKIDTRPHLLEKTRFVPTLTGMKKGGLLQSPTTGAIPTPGVTMTTGDPTITNMIDTNHRLKTLLISLMYKKF